MNEKIIIQTLCSFFISLLISCIAEVCNYSLSSYENDYINFIICYNYYIIILYTHTQFGAHRVLITGKEITQFESFWHTGN
jgi:hypothetical protein